MFTWKVRYSKKIKNWPNSDFFYLASFSHILALEWYLFIAYFFFIQGNTSSNKGITKILFVITFFKKKKSSFIWWLQWNPCKSWKDTHKLIKVKKHVNMFFFSISQHLIIDNVMQKWWKCLNFLYFNLKIKFWFFFKISLF